MASDNETETCKQVESPDVTGNPEDVSKKVARVRSSKLGFGFWFFFHAERERRQKESITRIENADERFAVQTSVVGFDTWLRQ